MVIQLTLSGLPPAISLGTLTGTRIAAMSVNTKSRSQQRQAAILHGARKDRVKAHVNNDFSADAIGESYGAIQAADR